jgi:1-acyl-sn-glycerol-3-phosphate acyltransferase
MMRAPQGSRAPAGRGGSETAAAPRRARPVDVARTLLALGAIVPGLVAGVAVWLVTRDRRRALNRALALWGELGTAAAGIRLEVAGRQHLDVRPAVFLINHQSGVDPIIVCALLRRDFVGVAKREVRRNPVLGPAFAFAGTVFLDRVDPERALRALAPAVETLRAGVSIAIAPEGTRSRDHRLGRFKKGAFRLALAARTPIVPIVIENSRDVLPRGAWIMTPATVRVAVHPPIATQGWSLDELDARIADVRRIYERALEPAASAPPAMVPSAIGR